MPKGIDQFVSEGRESIHRLDATFVSVSGEGSNNHVFSNNQFEIETSVRVYTRDLNNSLISGHPNGDRHGSGYGESGDGRGSWTLLEDTENSEQFVVEGRNIVSKSLAGQTGTSINELAVGNGTTSARPTDSSLESQNERSIAYAKSGANSNESTAESIFLFAEYGDTVSEYGVYSRSGNLFNRITTNTLNPSNEKELRVEIDFTVTQQTTGTAVITDAGKNKVAESIRSNTPIGLNQVVYGTDSTPPDSTDTSLGNRVLTKNTERNLSSESVTARTVVFKNEPSTQPHDISEIGVIATDGTLYWRTVIEPFTKDSETQFATQATFRIK